MNHQKVLLLLLLACTSAFSYAQKNTISLGVVTDCPGTASTSFLLDEIMKEAKTLLKSDYRLVLEPENIIHSDCNVEKAKENLDRLLADSKIDMVLGLDALSSHVMASNGPYRKPVIATTVINAQVQKIPITIEGRSGVKNLTYLELPYSPIRDIEVFSTMIGFEKLALLIDEEAGGIPEIRSFLEKSLNELGITYEFVLMEDSAPAVITKLGNNFDAVYLFPSDRLGIDQYQQLINAVNEKGLLSFSLLGRPDVNKGVLAGAAPSSNIKLIARRMALNIQRIANGEKAGNMNVKLPYKEELVINMATARQVDFSPSWETMAEAVLINELQDDIDRKINIFSAISEGIGQNLNIRIAENEVEISTEDVNIAKANLLPEVTASASHTVVDDHLATISNGQSPEHKGAAGIQLSQVIYSEQVTANKQIQELLLKATESALEVQSLDIVLDVSTAYLNLMQAKTAENIQKQNLDVTRKNLELARISSSLGQSGPSDLYRWQGEIANAKSNLLNATAQRKQAEMALNQILYRPISEAFLTEEIDITDSRLLVNNQAIGKYVNNPRDFYKYADFMVGRAKANVPDLKQLDYNVRAQERSVLLNRRNRYIPNLTVGGGYNYELYRNGAGTEFPTGFGVPNDWNWNLQVGAAIPIFQGGSRTAKVQQSRVQLSQLSTQRLNTERLIEQQVRSELENIRASYRNMTLTKDAEEAAVKNFGLIQDSYSKGVVTITQLLDAQNAAISSQLNSANAIYIFLSDLLNMERATGAYYMLMTNEQKTDYVNQLESFFNR
ncbi:MAG: TolC family protein [Reichenbachiella sp.]|uniref:TolC family protein n=2 Tax=Reichenbachiella sp. TaxID=2184521 RepID=UPI003264BF4A